MHIDDEECICGSCTVKDCPWCALVCALQNVAKNLQPRDEVTLKIVVSKCTFYKESK